MFLWAAVLGSPCLTPRDFIIAINQPLVKTFHLQVPEGFILNAFFIFNMKIGIMSNPPLAAKLIVIGPITR